MSPQDSLSNIVDALNAAGIEYMLTGSLASSLYGTPRATRDIDLVIVANAEQIRQLKALLPEEDYYFDLEDALEAVRRFSQFNVIEQLTMWKVDLILRKDTPYDHTAFERRVELDHQGLRVVVTSPEDSILSKLRWAQSTDSEAQRRDVAGILRERRETLDRGYIEHWIGLLDLQAQWDQANRLV